MKREIDGFVMNRLQGALLEEAFRLVADGYCSGEDVDIGLREGSRCAGASWVRSRPSTSTRPAACATMSSATRAIYRAAVPADAAARRLGRPGHGRGRGRARASACRAEELGERQRWRDRRLMALAAPQARGTGDRRSRRAEHGQARKVIITCAVTGAIHTPLMSPHLPVTPDEIADAGDRRGRGRRCDLHLHARDPETGKPDQTPEAFGRFLPRIKQRTDCGGQPHHRRRPRHDGRGAGAAGGDLQARGRLAQHGLDEFRPVPDARPLQGLQVTTGSGSISRAAATSCSATPSRTSSTCSQTCYGQRHALRVRMLRHRPSLQSRPFPRPRPGEAAAVRPVGVRHPGRHRPASRGRACT